MIMALTDDMKTLTGADDAKAELYLSMAESIIINRLYSNIGTDETPEFPLRYTSLKLRIAIYLFNKEGAEGETMHTEGGVSRMYGDSDIPASMLNEIVPLVKVL